MTNLQQHEKYEVNRAPTRSILLFELFAHVQLMPPGAGNVVLVNPISRQWGCYTAIAHRGGLEKPAPGIVIFMADGPKPLAQAFASGQDRGEWKGINQRHQRGADFVWGRAQLADPFCAVGKAKVSADTKIAPRILHHV